MNIKRLILAIIAGYVVIFATDFLIHHVWMKPDYEATQQVWRAELEMKSMMGWFIGAQIVTVITFVLLWTRWADSAQLGCAVGFGFLMGAFSGACRSRCTRCSRFLARLPANGSSPASRNASCSVSSPSSFTSLRKQQHHSVKRLVGLRPPSGWFP
jgi:hypothetical protein